MKRTIGVNGTEWPVVVDPLAEHEGYCYPYPPCIVIRRLDHRVLLHEVLHAAIVMHPNVLVISGALGMAFQGLQEGLVRYLTSVLYEAGYRWCPQNEGSGS